MKRGILIITLLILTSTLVSAGLFTGVWQDYLTGRQVSENSDIIIEFELSADFSQASGWETYTSEPTFHLYTSANDNDAIELVSKGIKTRDVWLYQKDGGTSIFYRDSENRVSFDNKEEETLRFKVDGFLTNYIINYDSSNDFSQASGWETYTSEPAFVLKSTNNMEVISGIITKQLFMYSKNNGNIREIFYKDNDNRIRSLDIKNRGGKISFRIISAAPLSNQTTTNQTYTTTTVPTNMTTIITKESEISTNVTFQENITVPISPISNTSVEEKIIPAVCNGCLIDNKCLPYGNRLEGQYCDISDNFIQQKELKGSCENNYECRSNECSNSECISTAGLLQRLLDILSKLFGK